MLVLGESVREWLGKWLRFEPHQVIGSVEDPYLLRWWILPRNPVVNFYLHKFVRSDDDRALHDHPWAFVSLVLRGGYWEHRARPMTTRSWRSAGSVAFRAAKTLHRVELAGECRNCIPQCDPGRPVWTLMVTGPRVRAWGFDCPEGWKHWEEFDRKGCEA